MAPKPPGTGKEAGLSLLLFARKGGPGFAERMMEGARSASALDFLQRAEATGLFSPPVLVTDSAEMAAIAPPGVEVELDGDEAPFHFGRRLLGLVQARRLERFVVTGAGSVPLLSVGELRRFGRACLSRDPVVVANNLYSADILGVSVAEALEKIDLPATDNALALRLWKKAGLRGVEFPRTPSTQYDIDSPADLLILSLHPGVGPHLRGYLDGLALETARLQEAARLLTDPGAEIVVAGRVGSHAWAFLERQTACRVRLFSEERGMRALGREEGGVARSFLSYHLEAGGMERFFSELSTLGGAVFLDSRVLLAHRGTATSEEDRFLSDLGRWEEIRDPFLRELTLAASEAPVPVVLGGHSLVSGGLMALAEVAWGWAEAAPVPPRRVR
ncbi:MAG: hypothetical protein HY685_01580 [Chloroflexi bacterium]|nr:hypothetical protein [Chloroflexota bacterium]